MLRTAKSSEKTSKSQAISSTSKLSTKPKPNRATSSSATVAAPMKHSSEEATAKASKRRATEAKATLDDMAAEAGLKPVKLAKSSSKSAKVGGTSGKDTRNKAKGISLPTLKEKTTVKSGNAKGPAPALDSDNEDEDAEAAVLDSDSDEEQDTHLHGFSTDDDEDSSDDEAMDAPSLDVSQLPTVAKDDATVKAKLDRAKKEKSEERGVLYIGRIPHGFYEDEMRAYFAQFGDVTRIRISRNKKTGASKHYGFLEFSSLAVAKIVQETMDNYLLSGHILRCKLIPNDQVSPDLWVGANRKWRQVPRDRVARVSHNKPRTEEEQSRAEDRLLRRQEEKKRKLEELGIDYDFGDAAYKKSKPVVSAAA